MNPEDFRDSPSGKTVFTPQGYWAFVPNCLPPPLVYDAETVGLLSEADAAVSRLWGVAKVLPNPRMLIQPYVRREAVLSSRIEGTQSSLSDLFFFEAATQEAPRYADVREVRNYVEALEYGVKRLPHLPLSLRLVKELHAKLMHGVRGDHGSPGDFRCTQNWIGPPGCSLPEASFVPPPLAEMNAALADWEKFLHVEGGLPPLVQCALMHYQFEAIHPFVDGNGRVGRLLITLFLCQRGRLLQPLLYLSAFFERHRAEYYGRLLEVSRSGDWVGWLRFFLRGVATQASDAVECADRILSLHQRYTERLQARGARANAILLVDALFLNPYVTARGATHFLKVTVPTAQRAIEALRAAGIVQEITGSRRNRMYLAAELLRTIEGETMRAPRPGRHRVTRPT